MTMTFKTQSFKFEVNPTSNGGYTVEVMTEPTVSVGCFAKVPGSKPGGQKNWNFDTGYFGK
jgi:hypothetical protein